MGGGLGADGPTSSPNRTAGKHGNFVVSKCIDKEFGWVGGWVSFLVGWPVGWRTAARLVILIHQSFVSCLSFSDQPTPLCRYGFDAQTLTYGNLLDKGVLDAATVTENAIQNSVSIASLVLTSGVRAR